jgi:hypothetical protein
LELLNTIPKVSKVDFLEVVQLAELNKLVAMVVIELADVVIEELGII